MSQQGCGKLIVSPSLAQAASTSAGCHFVMCQKVVLNGGLNLSVLDGWWAEAYAPDVGWAIGDGREHGEDPAWDAAEAEALYVLLEEHIIPEFYERNDAGIPAKWVARVRESMARLTPEYSAHRAVRQYARKSLYSC